MVKESEQLREQMLNRRRERAVPAKDWWRRERQQVLGKELSEDVHSMYTDCLRYDKFSHAFKRMWHLPDDYAL